MEKINMKYLDTWGKYNVLFIVAKLFLLDSTLKI